MISIGKNLKRKNAELSERIRALEERLAVATNCLEKISEGNFDFGLMNIKRSENEESQTFMSTLSKMEARLKLYSDKEHERTWIAEGMSKFLDLVQGDNRTRLDLYDKILCTIVNYVGANQGGLFTLNDEDPQDVFLEMASCYAYGKKRFSEKKNKNWGRNIGSMYS